MVNKKLLLEENSYIEQYHQAIFKLMDKSDISKYTYPLINLIHQTIENEIKSLIAESYYDEKTYKELKIDNTHNLKSLIENENLKKYYDGIEDFIKIFNEYKEVVLYFSNILGKNTFLNSRYAIKTDKNEITLKEEIDYNAVYSNWTKYSELYSKIYLMYISYSFSNTIIYFKNKGKTDDELELIKIEIINEMREEFDETYCAIIYNFMDKYIARNKYVDYKYVN